MIQILIVGGIHGNEPTGIAVARHFIKNKVLGFTGLITNQKAIEKNKRFLETDLNRSFDTKTPTSLEEILATKIKPLLTKYDLIIDIHNTKAKSTTCAIVTSSPSHIHFGLAKYFGFSRLVKMPPSGSLIAQHHQSISLEISTSDTKKFPVKKLISKIIKLNLKNLPTTKPEIFHYTANIQKKTLERTNIKRDELHNFVELTERQKKLLNLTVNKNYYPIFKKRALEKTALTLVEKFHLQNNLRGFLSHTNPI